MERIQLDSTLRRSIVLMGAAAVASVLAARTFQQKRTRVEAKPDKDWLNPDTLESDEARDELTHFLKNRDRMTSRGYVQAARTRKFKKKHETDQEYRNRLYETAPANVPTVDEHVQQIMSYGETARALREQAPSAKRDQAIQAIEDEIQALLISLQDPETYNWTADQADALRTDVLPVQLAADIKASNEPDPIELHAHTSESDDDNVTFGAEQNNPLSTLSQIDATPLLALAAGSARDVSAPVFEKLPENDEPDPEEWWRLVYPSDQTGNPVVPVQKSSDINDAIGVLTGPSHSELLALPASVADEKESKQSLRKRAVIGLGTVAAAAALLWFSLSDGAQDKAGDIFQSGNVTSQDSEIGAVLPSEPDQAATSIPSPTAEATGTATATSTPEETATTPATATPTPEDPVSTGGTVPTETIPPSTDNSDTTAEANQGTGIEISGGVAPGSAHTSDTLPEDDNSGSVVESDNGEIPITSTESGLHESMIVSYSDGFTQMLHKYLYLSELSPKQLYDLNNYLEANVGANNIFTDDLGNPIEIREVVNADGSVDYWIMNEGTVNLTDDAIECIKTYVTDVNH